MLSRDLPLSIAGDGDASALNSASKGWNFEAQGGLPTPGRPPLVRSELPQVPAHNPEPKPARRRRGGLGTVLFTDGPCGPLSDNGHVASALSAQMLLAPRTTPDCTYGSLRS